MFDFCLFKAGSGRSLREFKCLYRLRHDLS